MIVGQAWIAISHGASMSTMEHEVVGNRQDAAFGAVTTAVDLLREAIRYF
jgi:nicotinamide mononucleotide (NMN) deamidase PncC